MQGGGAALPPPKVGQPATYWLLQKASKTSFPGFSCSVTKNQESHLCGIWSYSKALKASTGQLPFEVSGEECSRIIRTKQFADESVTRTRHPLTVPGINIIEAFTTGAELITDDGNVVCQGQAVIVNGKSVQRAVTSAVYIVTIKEEEFSLDTVTKTLFAEARREVIPCTIAQGNCATLTHAYVWSAHLPGHGCPYVRIRPSTGTVEGNVFVSSEELLVVELGADISAPEACGDLRLSRTMVANLFMSPTAGSARPAGRDDVDLSAELRALEFAVRDMQQRLDGRVDNSDETTVCRVHAQAPAEGDVVTVSPGRFLQRQGDVIFDYTCVAVTVYLREDTVCYREIPITHSIFRFADPVTKIAVVKGTPRPCLAHFPLTVMGATAWYTIAPHVKLVGESDIPAKYFVTPSKHPHDFHQNLGVYTESELREWTHMVSVGHLSKWTTETLSTGLCQSQGDCPLQRYNGQQSFSLSALESQIEEAITPDWMVMAHFVCSIIGTVGGFGWWITVALYLLVVCCIPRCKRDQRQEGPPMEMR